MPCSHLARPALSARRHAFGRGQRILLIVWAKSVIILALLASRINPSLRESLECLSWSASNVRRGGGIEAWKSTTMLGRRSWPAPKRNLALVTRWKITRGEVSSSRARCPYARRSHVGAKSKKSLAEAATAATSTRAPRNHRAPSRQRIIAHRVTVSKSKSA